ncbi:MAG: hypothetical protein ABW168_03030 [Sedimenticola sp.]
MCTSFEQLCQSIRIRRLNKGFLKSREKAFKSAIEEHARKGQEDTANRLWVLKTIFEVQNHYLTAFNLIKKKKYYKAWCELEHCEVSIHFLSNHYNPTDYDKYLIGYISKNVESWQSLYPYKMFISPEILEKKIRCNICGMVLSPFSRCSHKVGDLYSGKMCVREVIDLDFLGISLVENPVQKYSVPFTKDEDSGEEMDHYDYSIVQYVAERLDNPFNNWQPRWTKKMHDRSNFNHVPKDNKCPCSSGKLFKDCCYENESILLPHLEVVFDEDLPVNQLQEVIITK